MSTIPGPFVEKDDGWNCSDLVCTKEGVFNSNGLGPACSDTRSYTRASIEQSVEGRPTPPVRQAQFCALERRVAE